MNNEQNGLNHPAPESDTSHAPSSSSAGRRNTKRKKRRQFMKKRRTGNDEIIVNAKVDNERTALVPAGKVESAPSSASASTAGSVNKQSIYKQNLKVSIKDFPGAFVKSLSGQRLQERAFTVSKFVRVDESEMFRKLRKEVDDENSPEDRNGFNATPNESSWNGETLSKSWNGFTSLVPASAALHLFQNSMEPSVSDPNTFLQGATEILTATMISCWIITLIFNPQVIDDNPLKDRLGYNDFCVGWDVMPASIVGSIGTFLYTMHMQRVHLSEPGGTMIMFSQFSSFLNQSYHELHRKAYPCRLTLD